MTRFVRSTIFVLLYASACFAQFPVTGHIVDDIEGKPVANAQVQLRNAASEAIPVVRTDAEGRFAFSVPEGTYKLAVEKAGFLPYPNDPIEVKEGGPRDLALVLTKTRSITARLVWPDGEPLTRALVWMAWRNGKPLNVGEGRAQASTDQLYFSNLQPGRYALSIDPSFGLNSGRTGFTTEFPSPEAVERGEVIDLRFTATRDLGTITVTETTGVEVSGRVEVTEEIPMTNFGGSQKAQPSIWLERSDGGIIARGAGQPDGTFRFPKVSPGTYYLVGNTQIPNYVTFGVQEIHVGATPVNGIVLSLPDAPPVITGRIEMETPQGPVGLAVRPFVRFTRPVGSAGAHPPAQAGIFSIPVPMGPGGPLAGLQFSLGTPLPTDAYIASFTQGQASYTRDPFPVAVSDEPVLVLFKQDGATIRGQVPISGNPPYPPFIVLTPKEREAEFFYRIASTDSRGSFQLQQIAPGTYDLFAFDRAVNYAGEQTLQAYQDAAVAVTVAAGESLTVNPNVVRIEK